MRYLPTVDASQDGNGAYVVQARYQYTPDEPTQGWTNVDYFDNTKPNAYEAAVIRANALGESKYVTAVRVIQVKEWYAVNLIVEPVPPTAPAPDTQPVTKP